MEDRVNLWDDYDMEIDMDKVILKVTEIKVLESNGGDVDLLERELLDYFKKRI